MFEFQAAHASEEKQGHVEDSARVRSIPKVFVWTKLGNEAGQMVSQIYLRKEMERLAGGGLFCWGIGNALGDAPYEATKLTASGDVEVIFTPMKSASKAIDESPSTVLVWLSYFDVEGVERELPLHMLVTSRGTSASGEVKKNHYALICNSDQPIQTCPSEQSFDASRVRNLVSSKPVGPSQVTSVVQYFGDNHSEMQKPYSIAFRARLAKNGFVRLGTPVPLKDQLLEDFERLSSTSDLVTWRSLVDELKQAAKDFLLRSTQQLDFFGRGLT